METLLTDELIENTYLYCWKRVANKDDARDIAQEIVVDAMLVLRSGKKIENFYGLYWSIASHKVIDFYRHKKPVKISIDDVENVLLGFDKSLGDYIRQEEIDNLSKSMNHLAAIYRDILVRFYVKDQSVKEISSDLSIPMGTVTKRLSDARKKLKENFENMENNKSEKQETEIKDYFLRFTGAAYNAYEEVSSLLDRQILFVCRQDEKSLEQISKEVQAAPIFVEESLKRLVRANLMFEKDKGKYLTDFVFLPKKADYQAYLEMKDIVIKMHFEERYFEILNGMKDELLAEDFYGKDFSWDYLLPYFIIRSDREFTKVLGGDYIRDTYIKDKYDRIWRNFFAIGYYGDEPEEDPDNDKIIGPGYNYNCLNSTEYGRYEVHNTINSMKYSSNGKNYELTIDRLDWINASNIALYRKLAENPNAVIEKNEEEYLAEFLSNGVIVKTESGYKGTVPLIPFKLVDKWCKSWNEKLKKLAIEFEEALYQSQKNTVLPYIRKDLLWASSYSFFPICHDIDTILMKYGIENNLVKFEEGINNSCTALVVLVE